MTSKPHQLFLTWAGTFHACLKGYDKIDYRNLEDDPNSTSHHGDPSYLNTYFGKTASATQLIFLLRIIDQPVETLPCEPNKRLNLFHIFYDRTTKKLFLMASKH